jgi:hypothetical protein
MYVRNLGKGASLSSTPNLELAKIFGLLSKVKTDDDK